MTEPARSQHPVDRLIRELIAADRAATADEIQTILDRIATAPFITRLMRVETEFRGQIFNGVALGAREPSLKYHLFKRIVLDEQWAVATSEQQYLADLHAISYTHGVRLGVYERQGGAIAGVITATNAVIPRRRLGGDSHQWLFAVYSADRGSLISGYQFTSWSEISIPKDAKWYSRRSTEPA